MREPSLVPHVLFRLGRQAFAITLADIRDVGRTPPLTAVPNAAPMVAGLCVLRERLAVALDLRRRFGLPPGPGGTALCVDHEGDRVALLVDKVEDVAILPPLTPIKPARDPLWQGVVLGVTQRGGETIVVLDAVGILEGALQE